MSDDTLNALENNEGLTRSSIFILSHYDKVISEIKLFITKEGNIMHSGGDRSFNEVQLHGVSVMRLFRYQLLFLYL